MPRTTTVESPGCPPIRALTFDVLGLVKVVEAKGGGERSVPKVVERWGEPDSSRCVLAASLDDRKSNPLLAVARKCGTIEVVNPLKGDVCTAIADTANDGQKPEDDPIVGLHLFRSRGSGSCTVLTCTAKGNARIRSFAFSNSLEDSASGNSAPSWKVCGAGNVLCSKVDASESHAVFGGKGVEVNLWDVHECTKIWTAKPPPKNSLGIFTPTWFTSATFLCKDDHRKIIAGTNSHQVRLYDISAQRRPVISIDFRETAIKAVSEDLDGYTIFVGNGSGDLSSFDMRTGKMLGSFLGKCSGSIRSIVRHPNFPVIASCGLDSYLRFWDIKSRQLLSAVFLKQPLNGVVFDSNFADEAEPANSGVDHAHEAEYVLEREEDEEEDIRIGDEEAADRSKKRKKRAAKEGSRGKKEKAAKENGIEDIRIGDEEAADWSKKRKKRAAKEGSRGKKEKAAKENGIEKVKEKKKRRSKEDEGIDYLE